MRELLSSANVFSLAFVFCLGTFFGSFLNVCIGRMPVGKSIVWPGSSCGSCGVPLRWWQNLPILSYLVLRGRCHDCHSPFSIRYLLLEVITGTMAAIVFLALGGLGIPFLYYFTFSCLLVVVFFVDLDAWIILDEVNYFGIAVGVLGAWALSPQYPPVEDFGLDLGRLPLGLGNVAWSLMGAVAGFMLFRGIAVLGSMLARQEAMGSGDVKFAALIGAFLGPQKGLLALFLSFPLGALVAVPMIVLRGRSGKTPVPFGTFMAIGAFLCILYGDHILSVLLLGGRPLPF